jgi:uncharacterized protein
MRLLITGGTGFVGRNLCNHLESHGHRVEVVSRRPNVGRAWDDLQRGVDGSDGVVHLAGAGVLDRRWSEAYREEILVSRTSTTLRVAVACAAAGKRLVSTSAVGYYGPHPMGRTLDEDSPPGTDFLARVCKSWEASAEPPRAAGANVALVRVGVVLGTDGGALKRMLLPFKLGLGGPLAGGRQPFPWIHVTDLCRLYTWLVLHPDQHPEQQGVFNGVAPGACDQGTFARGLGAALGRPAFMGVPGLALRILLGERAELLTTGQEVIPARALAAGFQFEFGELGPALEDLVGN